MDDNFLLIARISRPHGNKGKVKINSYAESDSIYRELDELYVEDKSGEIRSLHINYRGAHRRFLILGFAELKGMDEVEELRGCNLYMDKANLKEIAEGEFYHFQLLGLEVITTEGARIGKIESIIETGSNDVFVVKNGDQEHLVPAVKDFIKEIDIKKGTMIVEPLEYT